MSNQDRIYQILVESVNSWHNQLQKTLVSSIGTPYECKQMLAGLEKNMLVFSDIQNQIQKALVLESPQILSVNKAIHDAIAEISKSMTSNIPYDSIINQIQRDQMEWQKSIQTTIQRPLMISDLAEALRNNYSQLAKSSLHAQESIARVAIQNLAESLKDIGSKYLHGLEQMANSYREFWSTIKAVPQSYFSLPHVVAPLLGEEMFLAIHQAEILDPQAEIPTEEIGYLNEIAPDKDQLCAALALIDPSLKKMYLGALDAIKSNNRDSVRQSSVSMRELITQVLHCLAPDEEFFKWNQKDSNLDKGRPTRKGRLLYIYKDVCSNEFVDVLEKDIPVFLEYMKTLQACTHALNPPLTKLQLESLIIRLSHHLATFLSIADMI
ncbi:MAG: hypothetical protein WBB67_00270 [bacterium]